MKFTVMEVNHIRYNPNRVYATIEEAKEAQWLANMSSGITHGVYEVIEENNGRKFRKIDTSIKLH